MPQALLDKPQLSQDEQDLWDAFTHEVSIRRAWIQGDPQPLALAIEQWMDAQRVPEKARWVLDAILNQLDAVWMEGFYKARAAKEAAKDRYRGAP